MKYYKSSNAVGSVQYKIGDTKVWKGTTYHYCDANHRWKAKWHTHPASKCRTTNRSDDHDPDATANITPVSTIGNNDATKVSSTTSATSCTHAPGGDITALLALALNLVGENDVVTDLIADAINVASMWRLCHGLKMTIY